MMNVLPTHDVMERLAGFIHRFTNGSWQVVPSQTVDDLYSEIYQLERTLANAPTRPMRVRKARPLEPLSEQQKIMDLAG
ncbi:MAG: hypothetical protein AB1801_07130 [Chloroflexota bacterium]